MMCSCRGQLRCGERKSGCHGEHDRSSSLGSVGPGLDDFSLPYCVIFHSGAPRDVMWGSWPHLVWRLLFTLVRLHKASKAPGLQLVRERVLGWRGMAWRVLEGAEPDLQAGRQEAKSSSLEHQVSPPHTRYRSSLGNHFQGCKKGGAPLRRASFC